MRVLSALLALLLLAPAVRADEPIPFEEWQKLTLGQTVYYTIDGTFFGREYYWPGTDRITFQHASGTCAEAHWTYADGIYCFHFDRPHCFAHVRRGGQIVIIPQNDGGTDNPEQVVERIAPVPFSCTPGLTS